MKIFLLLIILFFLGTSFGSFFCHLISWRKREGVYSFFLRSRCDHCSRNLSWYELIPILSYFLFFGKCRTCREAIPFWYPVVEFLTGISFLIFTKSFIM